MAIEIGKVFGKEKWKLLAFYLCKIMENKRKGRWKVTSCMWGGKLRKIMENEENIGLIDKMAFEDQLVPFCYFSFGALSLFSPSLALGHLYFSWST